MRIALIAMSGVRAYNPELTALGLSLPGFVERGKTIASLPSLGLLTLAALTDDRHEIDYYEVDDIADVVWVVLGEPAQLERLVGDPGRRHEDGPEAASRPCAEPAKRLEHPKRGQQQVADTTLLVRVADHAHLQFDAKGFDE